MRLYLLIAGMGALGAIARFGLGGLMQRWLGPAFPWGTLGVNLLGCFAIGALMHIGLNTNLSPNARQALAAGFLGAFTTFSAFGYETLTLMQQGAWRLAAGNILGNLVCGLLLVRLGQLAAKSIVGGA